MLRRLLIGLVAFSVIAALVAPTHAGFASSAMPATTHEEVQIQVKSSFPHRRFDEEDIRPHRVDIMNLTVRIEELQSRGINGPEVHALIAERDALLAEIEAEQIALAQEIIAHNRKAFEANLKTVEEFLIRRGLRPVRGTDGTLNVVLPTDLLAEVRALPQVAEIRPPVGPNKGKPHLAYSVPTVGATTFHNNGTTGTGIKVGIVDDGIGTTDFLSVSARKECVTPYDYHGKIVASVVGQNKTGSPKGVAYGVSLYDAVTYMQHIGFLQDQADACMSWLSSNGVNVANTSWSFDEDSQVERSYDWYADRYAMLHTISLGNIWTATVPEAPATSHNVVTVSGTDDRNTTSRSEAGSVCSGQTHCDACLSKPRGRDEFRCSACGRPGRVGHAASQGLRCH